MLLFLTTTLVIVATLLWSRYRKHKTMVGDMPGYFQAISHGNVLMMAGLIPRRLFGFELFRFGPSFYWLNKWKELYQPMGEDFLSLTSLDAKPSILLADADLIKKVTGNRAKFPKPVEFYGVLDFFGKNIVTVEGDLWRKHRKVVAPSFTDSNNRLVHEQTLKHTLDMIHSWHESSKSDSVVARIDKEMIKLTLYVISGAGFGIELGWENTDVVPKDHKMPFYRSLEIVSENTLPRLIIPKWIFKNVPMHYLQEIDTGFEEFGQYMTEVLQNAKRKLLNPQLSPDDSKQADLLTALVEASISKDQDGNVLMEDSDLTGNTFIFLLAGHETTAHTLIFALILLALNPDEQERAYKEVETAIGPNTPTYEDYNALHYCLCVFYEALRLFPPVVMIPKKCGEDVEFGKYQVKEGTYIDVHVAALHRNPKYWGEDADAFKPSRFDTRNGKDYRRDAFIPFSDGMRSCLGKRFAQVEAVCVLAVLCQRYQISLADEKDRAIILEAQEKITTTPIHPVNLKFTPRRISV